MNIAKLSAGKIGFLRTGAALAVLAAICVSAVPVSADSSLGQSAKLGAIRLGAYLPTDSNTTGTYGNYMWDVGLDYTFQQSGTSTRDIISVDYIENSKDGHTFQNIPVTVGQQMLFSSHTPGTRPYVGYGIGLYNLRLKDSGNYHFNGNSTVNGNQFGGYVEGGFDLGSSAFIDARYHITSSLKTVNPDGFSLTAGLRF